MIAMETRPLIFLGETRTKKLCGQIEQVVHDWLKVWGGVPELVQANVVARFPLLAGQGLAGNTCSARLDPCGSARVEVDLPFWSVALGLAQEYFAADADPAPVASSVQNAILRNLVTMVAGKRAVAVANENDAVPPFTDESFWTQACFVTVLVKRKNRTATLAIAMTSELLSTLVSTARKPVARADMADRKAQILDKTITVVAELGVMKAPISEFIELAQGDVLILDQALDMPVRIMVSGANCAAEGHLGQSDGRRAIRISSVNVGSPADKQKSQ